MSESLEVEGSATARMRDRSGVRRKIWKLGLLALTLAAVFRVTVPSEIPESVLEFLGLDTDGFSSIEAAALACDLPAVTAVNDPTETNSDEFRGALVISGGGEMPAAVSRRFLELAGGSTARLVIIPTATDDKYIASDSKEETAFWKKHGFRNVEVLH